MTVKVPSARAFLRSPNRERLAHIALLLGTTMLVSHPAQAQAGCTTEATVQTCSGDQSGGVTAAAPTETLVVGELTAGIAPGAGTVGILYETDTGATLLGDTGGFAVTATGADGIRVGSTGGDVYIDHSGDVDAGGGRGIFAFADNGAAVIEGSGDVTSSLDAISANPRAGAAVVNWSGDITSTEGQGIALLADNGGASAEGDGAITAAQDAVTIDARGDGGNSSFKWDGDITSTAGRGVTVSADNGGSSVEGAGSITAELDAVTVSSNGSGTDASFNWTGDIRSTSGTAVIVESTDGGASVNGGGAVSGGVSGFTIDARGSGENANLSWDGVITAGEGHGISVYSANGGADAAGEGAISAGGFGVLIETDANGRDASLDWTGDITSTESFGARVETADGAATVKGSGTIAAAFDGLFAASIGGNAQVIWDGGVTATAGYGLAATSNSGGATVSGTGAVSAGLDAITATTDAGSTATVSWTGDVSSAEGSGILVSSASGASSVSGSGVVTAAIDGINVSNTSTQAASLSWNGDITGGSGEGVQLYSAGGAVTASGKGAVSGGAEAFHLETDGDQTAALGWTGDITSTGSNGVHITSALGAVSSQTKGALDAAGGGIYALSGSGDSGRNVTVSHEGSLVAGGVGVEAGSPVAPVDVKVTGDMQTGSYGIYTESRGDASVSVQQIGSLTAGNGGVFAYSSNGAVSAKQAGELFAYGTGITAANEGGNTVFVEKIGNLEAVGDGITAGSAQGNVAVRMTGGDITAGASGIVAGNEGDTTVSVEMTGNVTAVKDGVMASSANGGVYAEVVGTVVAGGTGVSAVNDGDGEVGVSQTGDVFAGGDGLVAGSATGNATVTLSSGVVTAKTNGIRLFGFGNLSANVEAGTSVTGGAGAAGLFLDGGLVNTVTNRGVIGNSGGFDEYAILSEANDTLVENFGTISGNILLGPWANDFNNYEGGLVETGSVLNVGASNTVTNAGTIAPGGDGAVATTTLTGNLETTATSRLAFDVDMAAGTADRIAVSGTAAVTGDLVLSFTTVSATPLSYEFITAGEGVSVQSLDLYHNAFFTSTVETAMDGGSVRLNLSGLDLAPEGVDTRGSRIGNYFNRAFAAGGEGVGGFGALIVNAGSVEGAEPIYDTLRPSVWLDAFTATYLQSYSFADGMMSCPVASGLAAPIREGSCEWTRFDYTGISRDSSGAGKAETDAFAMSIGRQRAIGEGDWRVGAALGVSFNDTRNGNGDSADSNRLHAGVSVKYAPGPFQLAAALTGSWGDVSSTRQVDLAGEIQSLTGETMVGTYNLKLRGAYQLGSDSLYLMPQLDLNSTYVTSKGFSENGGSAALDIGGMDETIFSLNTAVEIGANRRYEDGGVLRAFAKIGATFYSESGVDLTSTLASDQTGVDGFSLGAGGDDQVWNLAAGITTHKLSGWSTEARVNMTLGGATNDQQASIKVRKTF
ncbi:MAG: hypothetical protein JG765_2340 [Cereibacter sp.]|jgi:hypothetical protein|nr:hypothetical protein [Cereibacter sp.]